MSCLLMTSSQLSWGLVVRFLPLCIFIPEVMLPCNAGECCLVRAVFLCHSASCWPIKLRRCSNPTDLNGVQCCVILFLIADVVTKYSFCDKLWPFKCIVGDSDTFCQWLWSRTFVDDSYPFASDPFCQWLRTVLAVTQTPFVGEFTFLQSVTSKSVQMNELVLCLSVDRVAHVPSKLFSVFYA